MSVRHADRVYDELLVTLARAGDRRAAERLAARWHPRLLRTARRVLRDEELAREAVQETWAGVWRGWPALSDPARFPAWAFGVLHRKCVDQIRAASARRARHAPLDAAPAPSKPADAEGRVTLEQAFARLSPDHRAAAALFYGEGLTLAEIAAATGVSLGTAKSRLFHARRNLRHALEGDPAWLTSTTASAPPSPRKTKRS